MSFDMCWSFFRVICRSFTEGIFIYSLIANDKDYSNVHQKISFFGKKNMFVFSFFYSFLAVLISIVLNVADFYRLASVPLVFFYFWYKQRNNHKNSVINYDNTRDVWYALTTAIILILAVDSFNSISHMLLHTSFVLTGTYDIVRSNDVFYQLYKTGLMFLDVFFIFLVYKWQFIKMKDIKSMSMYKRVPISFGLCLVLSAYISYTYYIFYNIPLTDQYRNALLWILALMLPSYVGFYLTITHLTRLLNLKENHTADENILVWIFNPSILETTHLDIYDSDVFIANFESKKLAFKRRLKKLGINDEYKGYSELVFCLILTKLFIGLKGWCFERDILGQASLVIDVPLPKLRKDIENIIEQVWLTNETETLIDGYYLPYHGNSTYDQKQHPKIEEFLIDIAKSV